MLLLSLSWSLYRLLAPLLALPTLVYLLAYLLPTLYISRLAPVPNLKARYAAEWALVTGGGSGIGKELCAALAKQGLNVVVASLDDDCLRGTVAELKKAHPALEFRAVPVDFSPGKDYLARIQRATEDIEVQCVFNNAGFIVTGFLDGAPLGKLLANMECNATAGVAITHHFVGKLVASKKRGCIVFTSSVAGYIPTPFAAMYASTKAFVSQFACCVGIEVANLGIDVCAVHPSPVASNFYDKVDHKIELMEAAQKQAVAPSELPNSIFKAIPNCYLYDIGGMAVGTRLGTWFLPFSFFSTCFAKAAPFLPDFKKHNASRAAHAKQQ